MLAGQGGTPPPAPPRRLPMPRARDVHRPPSRWRRAAAALSLLLHLVVAAGAPLAEARAEGAARGAYDHVESRREQACTPGHDHLHCAFCRVLRTAGGPPLEGPAVPCSAPRPLAAARAPSDPHVPSPALSALGPRAPPAA